jgi:putative two-component system response regulator
MEVDDKAFIPPNPHDPSEPRRSRILVIDDDAQIRSLLGELLLGSGCQLEQFGSAEPALEKIHADVPDVVFLDLGLPDRNGHHVLEELRSNPSTRLLPVVVLTGHGGSEDKIRALREGATDFLHKPFSREELLARVGSLLSLKQFADEHEHAEHVILTLARAIDARDP